MKPLACFLSSLVILCRPTAALAAPPDVPAAPAPSARKFDPDKAFAAMDTNKDGKLSPAEFDVLKKTAPYFREHPEAVAGFFKRLDENGDGMLSLDEYRKVGQRRKPAAVAAPPQPRPAPAKPSFTNAVASAADIAFFEKSIRPVLVKNCYDCHSAEAKELKAGFALDSRDALLKGGDSGAAVVPGQPEQSLLITSLSYTDPDLQMPPKKHGGKLPDAVISDFTDWIKRGLPMPTQAKAPTHEKMEARLAHWAFQPVKDAPAPAVKNTAWARTDIDRFILSALEAQGLAPVADADPAALLRRVHLDLTGLPPTAEQVSAFLTQPGATRLECVIDELMKSPQFGERWGRHWLDVARYAESSGKETDFAYAQAWRYRDYVIATFNQDKPFDQFIREQIAGDLLRVQDDRERAQSLIATGFLAIGPKSHAERDNLQFEMDVVDEQIDTVSQAFLGATIACARCHDHKYDPITQRDYYAMAGIFRSTDTRYGTIRVAQNAHPTALVPLPAAAGLPSALSPLTPEKRTALEAQIQREIARLGEARKKKILDAGTAVRLASDRARLASYEADGVPKKLATCVLDRESARDSELFLRGEVKNPGEIVPRGLPALAGSSGAISKASGRLELATWIASPENPLTARVIVNRIWLHIFGQGIVTTPDNFGLSGERPSHPELLDHLATRFVKEGWSVKRLIRELMTSHVYALGTARDAKAFGIDPGNTLLWRMSPRRLEAESIRDAMLLTAGQLDLKPPTGSAVGTFGEGYVIGTLGQAQGPIDQVFTCRSVYLPVMRNAPLESLVLFDMAPGSVVTGERPQTTVPTQSLYLLNSPYVMKMAELAAQKLLTDCPDGDSARVSLAYQRIFNRAPSSDEIRAALDFIQSKPDSKTGWTAFCQALWASHEFLSRS